MRAASRHGQSGYESRPRIGLLTAGLGKHIARGQASDNGIAYGGSDALFVCPCPYLTRTVQ